MNAVARPAIILMKLVHVIRAVQMNMDVTLVRIILVTAVAELVLNVNQKLSAKIREYTIKYSLSIVKEQPGLGKHVL